MLEAIRWEPSPLRLIITVSIYLMLVKAMYLVVAPYRWRHGLIWFRKQAIREKLLIGLSGLSGLIYLAIGIAVF